MTTSPYSPPAAAFPDSTDVKDALRWHVAGFFAFWPLLLMAIIQTVVLNNPDYNTLLKKIQPLLFFAPLALLAGASGYGVARNCTRGAAIRIVLIGLALGLLWGIAMILVGNVVITWLSGGIFQGLKQQALVVLNLWRYLCPLGVILCGVARWYGRRAKFQLA